MTHQPTDEDLLQRARAGDEVAARLLFDRWLPELRRRVRRRLQGAVRQRVAESDVVQEAYLTAYLRMEDFEDRGDGSFGRWLGRILDHKLRDAVRHHLGTHARDARREHPRDAEGPELLPPDPQTPSRAAMGLEDGAQLEGRLAALPQHYRQVLRLVHWHGLTFKAIGECTNRSADAVGKLYARALDALGRSLEDEGTA